MFKRWTKSGNYQWCAKYKNYTAWIYLISDRTYEIFVQRSSDNGELADLSIIVKTLKDAKTKANEFAARLINL